MAKKKGGKKKGKKDKEEKVRLMFWLLCRATDNEGKTCKQLFSLEIQGVEGDEQYNEVVHESRDYGLSSSNFEPLP